MNLRESITKTMQAFEISAPISELHGLEEFESQYQKMLGRGLIEEVKYNLAPISTLPVNISCMITYPK